MVATPDRRHIITADTGQESLLVVWDSTTAEPVQTISCPHSHGITAMDVSTDGLLLVTIGSPSPGTNSQDVSGWLACAQHQHNQAARGGSRHVVASARGATSVDAFILLPDTHALLTPRQHAAPHRS